MVILFVYNVGFFTQKKKYQLIVSLLVVYLDVHISICPGTVNRENDFKKKSITKYTHVKFQQEWK
jgi:hypothetical protein